VRDSIHRLCVTGIWVGHRPGSLGRIFTGSYSLPPSLVAIWSFTHHKYWQSKITFIDKLSRITSSFKILSSGLVWMESWENRLNQVVSDPNQASQAGFLGNNTWLKKTEWVWTFLVTINSRCTTVELALSVDGLLKNVLAQHLPDTLYIFCGNIYRRFEIL
jgi:hypothetical protein